MTSSKRAEDWLRRWAWEKGWLVLIPLFIVAGFIWSPFLELPPATAETPHIFYLLSALAQSLAAVLALVFTISLIVAQLSSRYSHRMLASFFDIPTIIYIFLFIAAVFMPFWLLAEPNPWAVKASLTLAAACLLFLVPYFLSFRDKLNPEVMLENLRKKASKQLKASSDKEPDEISTIDNTIMSAFVLKDYDTFEKGVEALADLALEACEKNNKRIGRAIFERLSDIGIGTIEDPRAPLRTVAYLRGVGRTAAEKGLGAAALWAASLLGEIGVTAAEKGLKKAAFVAAHSLGEIGRMAAEKGWDAARAASFLDEIGRMATENGLGIAALWAVYYLGKIGEKAVEKGLDSVASEAAISLWMLGAWATLKGNPDLQRGVVANLRTVESAAGAELLQSAFKDAEKSLSQDPRGLSEALQRFKASHFP